MTLSLALKTFSWLTMSSMSKCTWWCCCCIICIFWCNNYCGLHISLPLEPRACFTNISRSENVSFIKLLLTFTGKIRIHLIHNFAHVTSAELSWHVQNYGSNGYFISELYQQNCSFVRFVVAAHGLYWNRPRSMSWTVGVYIISLWSELIWQNS